MVGIIDSFRKEKKTKKPKKEQETTIYKANGQFYYENRWFACVWQTKK